MEVRVTVSFIRLAIVYSNHIADAVRTCVIVHREVFVLSFLNLFRSFRRNSRPWAMAMAMELLSSGVVRVKKCVVIKVYEFRINSCMRFDLTY
jgi:hypothetical protein